LNSTTDWLATGGAYYVIGAVWTLTAAFFCWTAFRIGRAVHSENDGCLLAICNILLTLFGGGIGLVIAPYPTYLLTSLLGAITFPSVASLFFMSRLQRRR